MFKQVTTEIVPLTPKFVSEFADLPTYKGDREQDTPVGKRRIKWLRRLFDEGNFHTPKWATAELDSKVYRVNGGHSSSMLNDLNGEFPSGMSAVVDRFACDDYDDLAELFDQFDNRKSIRTTKDKINAHRAIHPELEDMAPTNISRALYGVGWATARTGRDKVTIDEESRVRLIHQHKHFLCWANAFVGLPRMGRVGVVACMFKCFEKSQREATTFWNEVRDESNPDNKSPSRVLAIFLRDAMAKRTSGNSNKFSAAEFYTKSIHAANAWKVGATTSLKVHKKSGLPKLKW